MHLSTVEIPISFELGWFWSSLSFLTLKPIFLPNLFALFLYYISWDPSLTNVSETIGGDRSNQFGLLTEHKFCRKLSRSISVDSRYCNQFNYLGRLIFSLNHRGASAATVFTIPITFGIALARCYTRAERATQFATESDHRYLMLLLFCQPITSPWFYLPSVRPVVLVQTQLQSIQDHKRLDFFSLYWPPAFRHSFLLVVITGDCAMTWAVHVLQKICRIKIS